MLSVAFHTLGCKVNQYDTQAMLEAFEKSGYTVVPFHAKADVYVINTCTVTGSGDKKSLQTARRIRRIHPQSELIIAGCMAQRMGEELLQTGARLIIGTQNRSEVVSLFEKAMAENIGLCKVAELDEAVFEPLVITSQLERTRAILKIQEGCDRHCTYCIIPSVRGPIRSRPLGDVLSEAQRLSQAGYRELVLTGIHLSSYGRDLNNGTSLLDVVKSINSIPDIHRIRLGSLEPNLITEDFLSALKLCDKFCPQFHLSLQSGCDRVLHRMGRRYSIAAFQNAVQMVRDAYPDAALTTDVIAGFPGETEEDHKESLEAIKSIAFSKLHVFPYSPREGTPAAGFSDQVSKEIKERRAHEISVVGEQTAASYRRSLIGSTRWVLFETKLEDGLYEGFTPEYVRVEAQNATSGMLCRVKITGESSDGLQGEIVC